MTNLNLNLWGEPASRTSLESAMAVMREINHIQEEKRHLEWFQRHVPLLVKELERQGVKFPKNFKCRGYS